MGQTVKATRANRTITVDFHNEATYGQLLDDTKACVECVLCIGIPNALFATAALQGDASRMFPPHSLVKFLLVY